VDGDGGKTLHVGILDRRGLICRQKKVPGAKKMKRKGNGDILSLLYKIANKKV
jgi:hypothetical protein